MKMKLQNLLNQKKKKLLFKRIFFTFFTMIIFKPQDRFSLAKSRHRAKGIFEKIHSSKAYITAVARLPQARDSLTRSAGARLTERTGPSFANARSSTRGSPLSSSKPTGAAHMRDSRKSAPLSRGLLRSILVIGGLRRVARGNLQGYLFVFTGISCCYLFTFSFWSNQNFKN